MAGFQVSMHLAGVKELQANLKELIKEVKKAQRRGVTKAGRVMRMSIKSRLPKESGLTRRRLGMVVRTYKSGVIVAVVGIQKQSKQSVPVKKVYRMIGRRPVRLPRPKAEQKQRMEDPAKILHLLELGFTQPSGKRVPGTAPIRRGHEAVKKEMETIIVNELKAGIEGAKLK